jgi:hypothetical protein
LLYYWKLHQTYIFKKHLSIDPSVFKKIAPPPPNPVRILPNVFRNKNEEEKKEKKEMTRKTLNIRPRGQNIGRQIVHEMEIITYIS